MLKIYGIEHILYLLVTILTFSLTLQLIKKKVTTEDKQVKLMKILGLILLLAILSNRITICIEDKTIKYFFPSTYCGASSLALSLGLLFLKRDSKFFHSVSYTGFIGGMLTLIYPDFLPQDDSLFYPPTITGLLHHTIMVYIVIVMVMIKYLEPALKKWYLLPIGLNFYLFYGLILITVFNYEDAMYIFTPAIPGTIFDWFVLGIIVLSAHGVFLYLWDYFAKRRMAQEVVIKSA
ncbi:MAG: hypothetical protein GX490_10210 [Bacilli bacterium]|nr:hypothetical protein [Bacilli bacterium]